MQIEGHESQLECVGSVGAGCHPAAAEIVAQMTGEGVYGRTSDECTTVYDLLQGSVDVGFNFEVLAV